MQRRGERFLAERERGRVGSAREEVPKWPENRTFFLTLRKDRVYKEITKRHAGGGRDSDAWRTDAMKNATTKKAAKKAVKKAAKKAAKKEK